MSSFGLASDHDERADAAWFAVGSEDDEKDVRHAVRPAVDLDEIDLTDDELREYVPDVMTTVDRLRAGQTTLSAALDMHDERSQELLLYLLETTSPPVGTIVDGRDLPGGLGDDADLNRQLDARYGWTADRFRFRYPRLPITCFDGMIATLPFYEQLAEEDRQLIAEYGLEDLNPDDLHNGEYRAQVVRDNIARLQSGRPLLDVVIDIDEQAMILDGYHRLAAAATVGVPSVGAWIVEPDE